MSDSPFSLDELSWLKTNPSIYECINESLEDSLNVNPLDNGEPDLIPYKRAIKAAHITLEIAQKKLIKGPYDGVHWKIICAHFTDFPFFKDKEKSFWQLFSFHCACSKDEHDDWPNEGIYMEAMKEMISMIEEGSFEFMEGNDNNKVANVNTGTIEQIKGKGVNAKFVG